MEMPSWYWTCFSNMRCAPESTVLTSEIVFSSAVLSPSAWRSRAFSIRSWAPPCSDAASLLSALLALATAVPTGQGLTLSFVDFDFWSSQGRRALQVDKQRLSVRASWWPEACLLPALSTDALSQALSAMCRARTIGEQPLSLTVAHRFWGAPVSAGSGPCGPALHCSGHSPCSPPCRSSSCAHLHLAAPAAGCCPGPSTSGGRHAAPLTLHSPAAGTAHVSAA